MNKKKKKTRIKHRKNKDRVRKLLQASIMKAKPKKTVAPDLMETEVVTKPVIKKAPAKKTAAKKAPAKKTPPKKAAIKKDPK